MFGFLKKAFRVYLDTYGNPGVGVTVYSTPDSLLDFYRLQNTRLPLPDETPRPKARKRARRASIWGGQGAAHVVSYPTTAPCGPKSAGF
jgi:hypothetical protein